jgi:CcmD family protein
MALAVLVAMAVAAGAGVPQTSASEVRGGADTQEAPPAQEQDNGDAEDTEEGSGDPEANLPFLFAVFIITWAVLFGFVFVMSRRQSALQREIETLRAALLERKPRNAARGEGDEGP